MPHAKPIGNSLFELRVRGKQEVRVIYVFAYQNYIVILHGFLKKTNSIPAKELKIANDRANEVKKQIDEL